MDTIDWSQERYERITQKLGQFLTKQARFKESDVAFVPCSGLTGENLVRKPTDEALTSWYNPAITLLERIGEWCLLFYVEDLLIGCVVVAG